MQIQRFRKKRERAKDLEGIDSKNIVATPERKRSRTADAKRRAADSEDENESDEPETGSEEGEEEGEENEDEENAAEEDQKEKSAGHRDLLDADDS